MIKASPLWREREELLRSTPCIGPGTARTLVAESARVGHAEAPPDHGPGGRGALRAAKAANGGEELLLGRTGRRARGALHGADAGDRFNPVICRSSMNA